MVKRRSITAREYEESRMIWQRTQHVNNMQNKEERQSSVIVLRTGRRWLCRGTKEYIRGTTHRIKGATKYDM
jgi:hypothetical protein